MTAPEVLDGLSERKLVRGLLQQTSGMPVVLVGSWARKTRRGGDSDIDLLIIGDRPSATPPMPVQVIAIPEAVFRKRVAAGDDFVQWALRYGSPLSGRARWNALRAELLPSAPWPDAQPSEDRARKRLEAATALAAMGDTAAAGEELLYAVSHLARAELLRRGVFPLSRPELPDQMRVVGRKDLADTLDAAIDRDLTSEAVRSSIDLVRRALEAGPQRE